MYSIINYKALVLVFLALDVISVVQAALYILQPASGSVCHAGEECTIRWTDDGESPLLSAIGVVTVGLYTGEMQLVQSIPAANVAQAQSITFTPIPEAGPNSDAYYIALTSTSATVDGSPYVGYSPAFKLDGMSGSFDSPLDSATASIPIPSSLTDSAASQAGGVVTTRTIGTLSTELPSLSISLPPVSTSATKTTLSSTSGFTTSRPTSSGSSAQSASAGVASPSDTNSATHVRTGNIPLPIISFLSFCLFFLTVI
ncbi:hypothetical protein VKT23_008788 [Stygiomarasmius scandens]|uniref:Yeast cell wall synthesis Kre9/Knh1-like N-terminal domain-containing protein n=1 Tax=Marasmiellus scandens TaxID=2682957 RepID=A0ABR1JIW3_9AGAR